MHLLSPTLPLFGHAPVVAVAHATAPLVNRPSARIEPLQGAQAPAAPRRWLPQIDVCAALLWLQRPLWAVVVLTPVAAAACVAAASLGTLPTTLLGLPAMVAVVLGSLLLTLGLAACVTLLEHGLSAMPTEGMSAKELRDMNESRQKRQLQSTVRGLTSGAAAGLDIMRATLGGQVDDQGLEGRQRFGTQQLTPTAAYARTGPQQPVNHHTWKRVSDGNPDGMGYNFAWSRAHHDKQSISTFASIMDQMAIMAGNVQGQSQALGARRPGEIFFGPMLGAWSASLMGSVEAGYTDLQTAAGVRLGFTGMVTRRDSINLLLNEDLPAFDINNPTLKFAVSRERSEGHAGYLGPSLAKSGLGRWWLRGESSFQQDASVRQTVDADVGKAVYAEQSTAFSAWSTGVQRAWFNRGFEHDCINMRALERLGQLTDGDEVRLTSLERRGALLAVGTQGLSFAGLRPGGVRHALEAIAGFAGAAMHGQNASVMKVACLGEPTTAVLEVSLTQHNHGIDRAYLTTPGALGYDRGLRRIDSRVCTMTVPYTPHAIAQITALYEAVRSNDESQQNSLFNELSRTATGEHGGGYGEQRLKGDVVSQDFGVPTNLLPIEIWGRWMPKGMAKEAGYRAASAMVEHTAARHFVAATAQQSQQSQVSKHGMPGDSTMLSAVAPPKRGFTVHHDQVRTFGPEGTRLCRVEAQVALDAHGELMVTLANHWDMDRANAQEMGAFMVSPLSALTGRRFGPLYGAGWRHGRTVTLSGALSLAQLKTVCLHVGSDLAAARDSDLLALTRKLTEAFDAASARQTWEPSEDLKVDPLRMVASALNTFTRKAHVTALPWLHALSATADDATASPLYLDTACDAYTLPAAMVRELALAPSKGRPEIQLAAGEVLNRISTCAAVLADDELIGPQKRALVTKQMNRAMRWAEHFRDAA